MRALHGHADTAESVHAVSGMPHQAVGMPAARRPGAQILAAIPAIGTARERISAAAIAEFFLKMRAQCAGPFIRGSVRIAVMKNMHGARHLTFLVTIKLLEKRNQCGRVLDG